MKLIKILIMRTAGLWRHEMAHQIYSVLAPGQAQKIRWGAI